MPRQINGLIDLSDDPAAEGIRPRTEAEDGEVWHFEDVLSIAAVAGKQHAPAAMRVGELATHLPKMRGLHVPSTIKAKHRPVLQRIDSCHHPFLRVPPFGLPLLIEGLLLLRCANNLHLRVELDGQSATDKLHPLTERLELA